jgi:hypothetical protein
MLVQISMSGGNIDKDGKIPEHVSTWQASLTVANSIDILPYIIGPCWA